MQSLEMRQVINPADIRPELDVFFDGLTATQYEHAASLADQLRNHGNEAFRSWQPGDTIEHVLFLADQEQASVLRTRLLTQYLSNPGRHPATIVAANMGEQVASERILDENLAALRQLSHLCTKLALPFSFYLTEYRPETPIGEIRADRDAASLVYIKEQATRHRVPPPDVLMVSTDADVFVQPYDTVDRLVGARQASPAHAWLGGLRLAHDRLDRTLFPRINKLLALHDIGIAWLPGVAPTQYAVNAGAYAAAGGMERQRTFAEAGYLRDRLADTFGRDNFKLGLVPGVFRASSRQLVHSIVHGNKVQYGHLASPRPAESSYRLAEGPQADISADRFQSLWRNEVRRLFGWLYEKYADSYMWECGDELKARQLALDRIAEETQSYLRGTTDLDEANQIMAEELARL